MPELNAPEVMPSLSTPLPTIEDSYAAEMDALVAETRAKMTDGDVPPQADIAPPAPVEAAPAQPATPAPAPAPQSEAAVFMAKMAAMEQEMAELRRARQEPTRPEAPRQPQRPTAISVEQLQYNPIAALEAAGIDLEGLAQHMVAKSMGKNAPAELRLKAEMAPQIGALGEAVRTKIQQLEERLGHYEQKDRIQSYEKSLYEHATGVKPEEYPMLGAALAVDRDGVLEDLKEVARQDAAMRLATGESGAPISPADAYKRLEQRYAAVSKRLAKPAQTPDPSPQVSPGVAAKKPAPAATMASLQGAPNRTTPMTLKEEDDALVAELKKKYNLA